MKEKKNKSTLTVGHIKIEDGHLGNKANLDSLAILPTRNVVLFPGVTISIALRRSSSLQTAQQAYKQRQPIGIFCQRDADREDPVLSSLYPVGVVAEVIKIMEMPDGENVAIVNATDLIKVEKVGDRAGHLAHEIVAKVKIQNERMPEDDSEYDCIVKEIKDKIEKLAPTMGEGVEHMAKAMWVADSPQLSINMLATNLPFDTADKIEMLKQRSIKERALIFLQILSKQEIEMEMSMEILERVRVDLDEEQRKQFLHHQLEVIHGQLYGEESEILALERRAQEVYMSEDARRVFDKEVRKLRRYDPRNPDYSVLYTYLETLLELPWPLTIEQDVDFERAQKALDQEHSGLEKVKDRIMEQLAVMMHNPRGKAPILCLVGPPGVGKTSLGQSIAKALGRKYQRISLGGLHDEAEIRGHRRTYIGSMPGRIIQAMLRVGETNPVLVLDEIDKIGSDYKGDPAAALLEVLDPEQNCRFHDNYIDIDFDLSDVLFIATANTTSTIAKPLLDRMEVIHLSGYSTEEKIEIAKEHLIRRVMDELRIKRNKVQISDQALTAIIDQYTSESGVRQLEKCIATIGRKYLLATLSGKKFPRTVMPEHLKDLLGKPPYMRDKYEGNEYAGVVTGLAWTEVGGEILLAEASLVPGKGKETVTGNLGTVMKESATIAYQWVRSHASQLGIDPELFEKYNMHLHFPEGAIPKDGPSAGITIATAIVSAFKQKRVRSGVAMTGEITLRGKVLPVGGIKEKILAAKRAGISDIVLSSENRKDIEEIAEKYIEGLNFHYVDNALQVMEFAVTEEDCENPLTL